MGSSRSKLYHHNIKWLLVLFTYSLTSVQWSIPKATHCVMTFYNEMCRQSFEPVFAKWPMHGVTKSCINKRSIQSARDFKNWIYLYSFTFFIATGLKETATCRILVIHQRWFQLSEKTNKVLVHFLATHLYEVGFSLPTLMKTTYHDWSYSEADIEIPAASIKADKTELCKNVKQCNSSH